MKGYEAATLVGRAATLNPAMHPHGVWGVVGGAAALAVYDGASADEIDETMRIAASLALATSRPTMLEGATVRNAYTGASASNAVMARRMARAGFTGDADALATVFGKVVGRDWDAAALTGGLGDGWMVERGYFKRHACCRFNHAALDALGDIQVEAMFEPESVERIEADVYALAAELDDPAPQNMLAAKFSLPFALATSIRHSGDTWLGAFSGPSITDPVTCDLAARVSLKIDPEFEAAAPYRRMARVHVYLKDGRHLQAKRDFAEGDPESPLPDDVHNAKLDRLFEIALGDRARLARERLLNALSARDIRNLTEVFRPGDRP